MPITALPYILYYVLPSVTFQHLVLHIGQQTLQQQLLQVITATERYFNYLFIL